MSCNCNDPCGDAPINEIQQVVNDALAQRTEELDGIKDAAAQSATDAASSATAAETAATEAQGYRDESQVILNSAQELVPKIADTATTLEETAELLEAISQNASSYQIVNYPYTVVGGESTIVLPADLSVLTVQSMRVEGLTLQSATGDFTYNTTTRTVTLAQAFDTDAAGLVITLQLGQSNADSPETVLSALAATTGALLIGTEGGKTVQEELTANSTGLANYIALILGTSGAANIGLSQGITLQQAMDSIGVYPEAFGTAYDDVRLQAAVNYAATNGKRLICTGRTFTLNAQVTLPAILNADFTASTIIAGSAITSGSAIVVDGVSSVAAGQYSGTIHNLLVLRALTNVHPTTGATVGYHADTNSVVDGVSFGASNAPQGMKFYNLRIYGFRDGLRFDGPNSYINHFYMADIGNHWRRGVAVYASSNSNENYAFIGGRVFNVNNLDFSGTGVYIDPAASKTDISFTNTSIDYCDYSAQVYQSFLNLNNCHLENNNNNPHILLSYTSGKEFPSLNMQGGDMATGPGGTSIWSGIAVEQTGGRDSLIYAANTGGVNVTILGTRCGNYSVTNPRKTQILKIQGNSTNILNHYDVRPLITAGNTDTGSLPLRICNAINAIVTSQYNLTSWTQTLSRDDGTITFTVDTTVYYDADSAHSRKYVGTGGYSTGLYQDVAVTAGQSININTFARLDALSAGYMALRVDFIDSKGNTISSSIKTITAVTTDWQELWVYLRVPNGAVKVRIQEYYNSFTGTAYFSNENVWVH